MTITTRENKWAFYYTQNRRVDNGNADGVYTTFNSSMYNRIDSRTGGDNPLYQTQIRRGEQAGTNFTGTKYKVLLSVGSASVKRWNNSTKQIDTYVSNGNMWAALGNPHAAVPFLSSGTADNLALQELYKYLRRTYRETTAGVTVGEWRETWRMMRNAAKAVRNGVDKYVARARKEVKAMERAERRREAARSRRDTEKAQRARKVKYQDRVGREAEKKARQSAHTKRVNKRLSELWLEYSFGWMPLIGDVKKSAQALARMSISPPARTRVIGKASDEDMYSDVTVRSVENSYIHYTKRVVCERETSVRYIAGIEELTYSSVSEKAMDVFGLDWREFVPTVWELIPYSFLVDYFTNVGDILEAAFTKTKHVKWLIKTERKAVYFDAICRLDVAYMQQIMGALFKGAEGSPSGEYQSVTSVNRTVMAVGALPLPTLELNWLAKESLKWLNIGALANGRRVGRT